MNYISQNPLRPHKLLQVAWTVHEGVHVGQKLSMQNAFLFSQIPQTSSTQAKFHEYACAA